jgi:hypothetical protein
LPAVAVAADIEYRTLHMWLRRGLLRASVEDSSGSGVPSLFNETDVLEARILADLRRLGVEMSVLDRTAAAIRRYKHRLTGQETLVINGDVEIVAESDLAGAVAARSPSILFRTAHAKAALQGIG